MNERAKLPAFIRCGIRRSTAEVLIRCEVDGVLVLQVAAPISGASACIERTRKALEENPAANYFQVELPGGFALDLDRRGAATLCANLNRAVLDLSSPGGRS